MDSKEETIRISEIRALFIKQCRNGIWKEHNSEKYVNDYFRIEFDQISHKKWSIRIDDSNILSSYIGISSFLFYFLRILVRFNALAILSPSTSFPAFAFPDKEINIQTSI